MMTIQTRREACTSTCAGKLSLSHRTENDEMFAYTEITELLMIARASGCADKKSKLPMRRSLFPYVPPYIIFQNKRTAATLPRQITSHLLWWHTSNYSPRVIRSTVQKSGFTLTTKSSAGWCGTWCTKPTYARLRHEKTFRKINRVPNSAQLGNKICLWRNFWRMRKRFGKKHFDYMPTTFVLPEERNRLKAFMQRNGGIWIVKPPASCAGRGIKIVTRYFEIPDDRSFVAQRYVSKPRLIDGIKFDIRLYVLLTSIDPLRVYVYTEGLVRLATIKYINDVSTLLDRFMHLTNTSINKLSRNFKLNDDPDKCQGNMWSLNCLWKYLGSKEGMDTLGIWANIKDIAIKTMISAESSLFKAWKDASHSTYSFYQLFGFDVLLDEEFRPWLLEVNGCPSMECDTPLCRIVKGQLAKDYLSLVGFHIPDVLTPKELKALQQTYGEKRICYDQQLYMSVLSQEEKRKQDTFSKMAAREDCTKTILKSLTRDDVKVLIRHEDEIVQTGGFEKIFPTCDTYEYLRFFDEVRYYNVLLHAWENKYGTDRSKGIERLRKLCRRKYHL